LELVESIGRYAAAAAALGLLLLLPLLLSQRRDLARLRGWMEDAPDHPGADMAASEAMLDRAEAELERLSGAAAAPPAAAGAAARVTSERPALERITIERAALAPHPRWRRFAAFAGQPRVLWAIAGLILAAGVAAILVFGRVGVNAPSAGPRAGAVNPADVTVAVLNGTSTPGLAGRVSDDVRVNGFRLGTVSNSARPYQQTVVMYASGELRAARKLARDLGVQPVQPVDRATRRIAGDADVVVIAGADRAR